MDFYQKAKLADKFIEVTKYFVTPDSAFDTVKYVYAKDGVIFCTNGYAAFMTTDSCVKDFVGYYNEETEEFEPIGTDSRLLPSLEKTYNMIKTHLATSLGFGDAVIVNIEDIGDPVVTKVELPPKETEENSEEEYNEYSDEAEEPKKKKRKPRKRTKTVTESFVKITFKPIAFVDAEPFSHIFQKETMLHIIEAFKGMPTFKVSNDINQPMCVKRNNDCKIEDDIFFLLAPIDLAKKG